MLKSRFSYSSIFIFTIMICILTCGSARADKFALIIGVAGDTSNQATANSKLFVNFLREYGDDIKIKEYYEEKATLEDIISEFKLLQNTSRSDSVIIHITAHGFFSQDKKYHFIQLANKNLSADSLLKYTNAIGSRRVIVILEVCYSGVFVNKKFKPGKWILTASDKDEITHTTLQPFWKKEFSGNIFTKNLIKAFKNPNNNTLQSAFKQAKQDTSVFWKSWAERINAMAWDWSTRPEPVTISSVARWQTPQIYPTTRDIQNDLIFRRNEKDDAVSKYNGTYVFDYDRTFDYWDKYCFTKDQISNDYNMFKNDLSSAGVVATKKDYFQNAESMMGPTGAGYLGAVLHKRVKGFEFIITNGKITMTGDKEKPPYLPFKLKKMSSDEIGEYIIVIDVENIDNSSSSERGLFLNNNDLIMKIIEMRNGFISRCDVGCFVKKK